MMGLRILADENIPCVQDAFARFGTVRTRPGRGISAKDVEAADVLLVRSVTEVGRELIGTASLQFVGSATIGTDHVDRAFLQAREIPFAHAPGSNADSVADYVVAALLLLARRRGVPLDGRTVGIIGCGNIGGRLARRLPALGLTVLKNDPPRARAAEADGRPHDFRPLGPVLQASDIVTLHVPLTTDGPDPTHHLVDAAFLDQMRDEAWLLNTSRGAVVNGDALLAARRRGAVAAMGLDVWEHEPSPAPPLVDAADVATPHIAGYAYDGKVRGTELLYQALCEQLGVEPTWTGAASLRPAAKDALQCTPPDPRLPTTEWRHHLARQAYDLQVDDTALRSLPTHPREARAEAFQQLRRTYRPRRELQQHTVSPAAVPEAHRQAVQTGLTIQRR
jgi:erythronate-4-phosphate dehydrogenase